MGFAKGEEMPAFSVAALQVGKDDNNVERIELSDLRMSPCHWRRRVCVRLQTACAASLRTATLMACEMRGEYSTAGSPRPSSGCSTFPKRLVNNSPVYQATPGRKMMELPAEEARVHDAPAEDQADVHSKIRMIAELLKTKSKRVVVYTGPGISVSAGIRDQEDPDRKPALSGSSSGGHQVPSEQVWRLTLCIDYSRTAVRLQAIPTAAHMCLAKLVSDGLV